MKIIQDAISLQCHTTLLHGDKNCPHCRTGFLPLNRVYVPGAGHVFHYMHASQTDRFQALLAQGLVLLDCSHTGHLLTLDIDIGAISLDMMDAIQNVSIPVNNYRALVSKIDTGKIDWTVTTSKSGGIHVYIHFAKPQLPSTRSTLASWLGSDPVREFLSMERWLKSEPYPWVMAELSESVSHLREWAASIGHPELIVEIDPQKLAQMLPKK